jgi:hypothetical protein
VQVLQAGRWDIRRQGYDTAGTPEMLQLILAHFTPFFNEQAA